MSLYKDRNCRMLVHLPENLDLPVLLANHKPEFCFKLDRCKFILHQLTEQLAYNRRLIEAQDGFPYVPLSSAILVRHVYNYNDYLKYLTEQGVLECDNFYVVGQKCKGYRYTEIYQTKPIAELITDTRLNESNNQWAQQQSLTAVQTYPELLSWFDGLELNEQAAIERIEAEYAKSQRKRFRGSKIKALNRYIGRFAMVNRFIHNPPIYSIDGKAHRLHTNLTNLWAELRPFLTFEGHTLVATDLSCSQPYLSTLLLRSSFYSGETPGILTFQQLPVDIQARLPLLMIDSSLASGISQMELVRLLPPTTPSLSPPTPPSPHPQGALSLMLGLLESKAAYRKEYSRFEASIEQGQLYEMMGDYIRLATGRRITKRQQLKDIMFSVFFSDNNAVDEFIITACANFKRIFPLIYDVFRSLKTRSNSDLALLLQAIEAELFLNRIARRISEERPDLPIYTLHDSIITIDGYQDYIREVMDDELYKATGVAPHFKQERWGAESVPVMLPVG